MILRSRGGYLRLLNKKDFLKRWNVDASWPERSTLAKLGFGWYPTRLELPAEVRNGSLEHQMLTAPWYFDAHEYNPVWPDSALFLYAEALFLKGRHPEFCALVIAQPAVAKLISRATVRWPEHRCRLTQAQDLVRTAYARNAAQAVLLELQK